MAKKKGFVPSGSKKEAPRKGAQQVRIIGGDWRSRRLRFADVPGLRPTLDRVRETLFNWLQWHIEGSRALDCFSGSGALGYEALSRQAAHVVFLEQNAQAALCLRNNLKELNASNAEVWQTDALVWLAQQPLDSFDLIFLDPPFGNDLLNPVFDLLNDKLKPGCMVYVEAERNADTSSLPESWEEIKRKDGKEFSFALYKT